MRNLLFTLMIGLVVSRIVMPAAAQDTPPPPPSVFDPYRAAAVTAGVVTGIIIAEIVTDGLVTPAIAYAMRGGAAAAPAAAQAAPAAAPAAAAGGYGGGAAAAAPAYGPPSLQAGGMLLGQTVRTVGATAYYVLETAIWVGGAVVVGLTADAWYAAAAE